MHSRDAGVHVGALKGGNGPRLGETSQAPRYRPSDATMPGPKGAARHGGAPGVKAVLRDNLGLEATLA
eukprot:11187030-Lingulodinium_polyedra.AAC.1